jgi:hypothetical protein
MNYKKGAVIGGVPASDARSRLAAKLAKLNQKASSFRQQQPLPLSSKEYKQDKKESGPAPKSRENVKAAAIAPAPAPSIALSRYQSIPLEERFSMGKLVSEEVGNHITVGSDGPKIRVGRRRRDYAMLAESMGTHFYCG